MPKYPLNENPPCRCKTHETATYSFTNYYSTEGVKRARLVKCAVCSFAWLEVALLKEGKTVHKPEWFNRMTRMFPVEFNKVVPIYKEVTAEDKENK